MRIVWGVVLALGLACVGGSVAIGAAPAEGPVTVAFTEVGAHTFTVPAGVKTIHVVAVGAPGGNGNVGFDGGRGGVATADVAVTPGQTLNVFVGGKGIDGSKKAGPSQGGFNGGGESEIGANGGGGGASDIRTGGAADLETRLVVAGGGGGGGGNEKTGSAQAPTSGRPPRGSPTTATAAAAAPPPRPGPGGNAGFIGQPGTQGNGGKAVFGGGGGGGLFGGGGGGGFNETFNQAACGGGGGSSGFGAGTSNTSTAVSLTRVPSVTITYVPAPTESTPSSPGPGAGGGTGTGTGPGSGGAAGTGPAANLSLPSTQHGKAVVGTVRIPSNRSSLKAKVLWQKGAGKPLLFGKLVQAGLKKGLHSFTVDLNGAGKRKLGQLGKLRLTLAVSVIPPTGAVLAATKSLTLKP